MDFSSFVDRVIPFDDLPTGLNDIRSGATTGRILVTIGDPDASLSKI